MSFLSEVFAPCLFTPPRRAVEVVGRSAAPRSLLFALAALAACSDAPQEEVAPAPRHSVILISIDTLRADRMSLYGYERPTTPELERFAEKATRYDRALAASSWTLPSHASMLTGLYPYEHGARTFPLDELEQREDLSNAAALAERFDTVTEKLKAAGYATGAIVANVSFLDAKWGMAQGFDEYESRRGKVGVINDRALRWIDPRRDEPFFLFLNYMDTHRPYNSKPRKEFPSAGKIPELIKKLKPLFMTGQDVPEHMVTVLSNDYDTSIANLDEGLGYFFDKLDEWGILDDCLVIVTSDHGEFLGEHSLIEHAKELYQEVVHVPLIVKQPGQQTGRVDEQWISHVHLPGLIAPSTPLDDIDGMLTHWPRADVLTEIYGARERDLEEEWGPRLNRLRRAFVSGDRKYIDSSDGEHELYDLADDPRELNNLVEAQPDAANELSAELEAWLNAHTEGRGEGAVELTPEDMEAMRAFGYAGDDDDED